MFQSGEHCGMVWPTAARLILSVIIVSVSFACFWSTEVNEKANGIPLNDLMSSLDDEQFCAEKDGVGALFCRQDTRLARNDIARELFEAKTSCKEIENRGPAGTLETFQSNYSMPWAARSRYKSQKESTWERDLLYSKHFPDAQISILDYMESNSSLEHVHVQLCGTPIKSSIWTFEKAGPFFGRGNEWHGAGWWDAGRFKRSMEATGPIWFTAFGFFPIDAVGTALGLPPVHIHHMHVTSTQSYSNILTDDANFYLRRNSDGRHAAVEFDVHGDRQCFRNAGGINCTMRAFPRDYGMRLADPVETFFDLKDTRPSASVLMEFYALHAYRWTHKKQRPFGKLMSGITPGSFRPLHDDYVLLFSSPRTEYMYWASGRWTFAASIVHMYWHAHHEFTSDMWVISASQKQLKLWDEFRGQFVNISALGHTEYSAKAFVLSALACAQDDCSRGQQCDSFPSIRCTVMKDRWEQEGATQYARYRVPRCFGWDFMVGEPFTIIAFHRLQSRLNWVGTMAYWMHAGFYAYYVPHQSSVPMPHAVGDIGTRNMPQSGMAWWDYKYGP